MRLGINIDHVATLRQARRIREPEPVAAAHLAELGGADSITIHLREDRRHIQDRDVFMLREVLALPLNLEMSVANEIVEIACKVRPEQATLVPEKREEVTTEGGLDVAADRERYQKVVQQLQAQGIHVSLFIDPDRKQLEAAKYTGAEAIELHTGDYANTWDMDPKANQTALQALIESARHGRAMKMRVHAGHGLNYRNVQPVVRIPEVEELNIGHSIISRAVMVGMVSAVREMKKLLTL